MRTFGNRQQAPLAFCALSKIGIRLTPPPDPLRYAHQLCVRPLTVERVVNREHRALLNHEPRRAAIEIPLQPVGLHSMMSRWTYRVTYSETLRKTTLALGVIPRTQRRGFAQNQGGGFVRTGHEFP